MALYVPRTVSSLTSHSLFASNPSHLRSKPSLSLKQPSTLRNHRGLLYFTNSSIRSLSEESSPGPNRYAGEELGTVAVKDEVPEANNSSPEVVQELSEDSSALNGKEQAFEFLEKIDLKLDSEDPYSLVLLGGGALTALWIATVVVTAIDSIPVFPKLLEVVGLGYTLWFSTRYLIFKRNREELVSKIEEIKQQVLGSGGE